MIVEAKGTYDPQIGAWHGPQSLPRNRPTLVVKPAARFRGLTRNAPIDRLTRVP